MKKYAIYLTTYLGNKLPMFYIGSSSVKRIEDGYHGTVTSRKYKSIWQAEIKCNPHLFKTKIICTYDTRQAATDAENRLQTVLNVIKSPMYINMATASVNGFFGMSPKGIVRSQATRDKISKLQKGKTISAEHRAAISKKLKGRPSNRKGAKMSKEFCEIQSKLRKGIPNLKLRGRKPTEEARAKMSAAGKGRKQTNDHIANRTDKLKKMYVIIHPCGKSEIIAGLTIFCKENDLKRSSLSDVVNGRSKSHKGFVAYRLEDFEKLQSSTPLAVDNSN